jgi:hypothetical protein
MSRLTRLAVVLAAAAMSGAFAAPAPAKLAVLQLRFDRVATHVDYVQTSGSFALVSLRAGRRYELIDDRTRRRTYLWRAGGCTLKGIAAPWILFDSCPNFAGVPSEMLYNVDRRGWSPFKCDACVAGDYIAWQYRSAMGSRWLWFEHPGGCPGEQYGNPCSPSIFVSIPSGATRTWQPSAGMAADLDSRALMHRFCWSLPPGLIGPYGAPTAPLLTALVWGGKYSVQPLYRPGGPYTLLLEGCHSRAQIPLLTAATGAFSWLMAANSRALTWWVSGRRVLGIFVPELRRFEIPLPATPHHALGLATFALALTSQRIFIVDSAHRLWAATGPREGTGKPVRNLSLSHPRRAV